MGEWSALADRVLQPRPDPDVETRAQIRKALGRRTYCDALAAIMAMAVENDRPGLGPMTEPDALDWALRVAPGANPDGWPDDPGEDAARREAVLAYRHR